MKDVADTPAGAKSANFRRDAAHQLIRMQAALHQGLALALMDHLDRLRRRGFALRGVDDLVARYAHAMLGSDVPDLCCRTHQDWLDDPGFGGIHRATQ